QHLPRSCPLKDHWTGDLGRLLACNEHIARRTLVRVIESGLLNSVFDEALVVHDSLARDLYSQQNHSFLCRPLKQPFGSWARW
ncbi:hypothetical protein PFISCL1PPCAC_25986, partial [Pristionchus fissidentatus]